MEQFNELALSPQVKRAIKEIGYRAATEIQAKTIPLILSGRDVIGRSQTGTGKTAAFAVPAVELCDPARRRQVQTLVLCPTRELAMQICGEMRKIYRYKEGVRAVAIYGGQPINRQIMDIRRGACIVVGTPGRILDHIRRRTLRLEDVHLVVLDEADEMLDMGFRADIEAILEAVPEERQTVLFSATMPPEILAITGSYQRDPALVATTATAMTIKEISQTYCMVPNNKKQAALMELMEKYQPRRSIIFCNTKRMVGKLCDFLKEQGLSCDALHGDMDQRARTRTMDAFKNGRIQVLVATDVAARGIDAKNVDVVFNFDLPQNPEYYIHRIGRTGRAGKTGRAVTILGNRGQVGPMEEIIEKTGSDAQREELSMSSVLKTVRPAVPPKKQNSGEKVQSLQKKQSSRGKSQPKKAQSSQKKRAPGGRGHQAGGRSRRPFKDDRTEFYGEDECIFVKQATPSGGDTTHKKRPAHRRKKKNSQE